MLHKIITRILIKLKLKKPSPKGALESLLDLLPILLATTVIMGAASFFPRVHLPGYKRWWYRAKYYCRYLRARLIGY